MERAEFDIDLSGEDSLPPGVQEGSLGGDEGASDIPPPKPGEFLTDPEEDREEDLPWNGNSNPAPEAETPVETQAPKEEEAPKPKPKRKRAPKKAPAVEPVSPDSPGVRVPEPVAAPAENNAKPKNASGTVDRPYRIFQIKPAEVEGQIIDVPVPVIFNAEGGGTMDTLVARNRDLAITKAAKLFGPGWNGTLVAVPIGMWEPEPVFNKPKNSFKVQIGAE